MVDVIGASQHGGQAGDPLLIAGLDIGHLGVCEASRVVHRQIIESTQLGDRRLHQRELRRPADKVPSPQVGDGRHVAEHHRRAGPYELCVGDARELFGVDLHQCAGQRGRAGGACLGR